MKAFLLAALLASVSLSAFAQERELIGPVPASAYSAAAKVSGGSTVFLAGVGPTDEKGELVAPGDLAGQAQQIWRNLERIMAKAGGTPEDIVAMTVFTTERRWNTIFTDMRRSYFKKGYPASAFVEVRKLRTPGAFLEIRATAVVPTAPAKE